jgi:hypothetical protein
MPYLFFKRLMNEFGKVCAYTHKYMNLFAWPISQAWKKRGGRGTSLFYLVRNERIWLFVKNWHSIRREREIGLFSQKAKQWRFDERKNCSYGKKSPILNMQTDIPVLGTDILVSFPIVYLTTINIKFIVQCADSLILGTIDFSNLPNNKLDIVQFFHQNISCSLAGH